jgi:hypothetical protein
MPFHATAGRRKLIVLVLLVFALFGAAIRWLAPNPSTLRDMGSLLLVLWVPVIGNVIAFLVQKLQQRRASRFPGGDVFAGELLLELKPLVAAPALATPLTDDRCALVVGTEGFSVRLSQPLSGWLESGEPMIAQAQFRKPAMALPHFRVDTLVRVVAQQRLVGEGRVLQVLGQPSIAGQRRPAPAASADAGRAPPANNGPHEDHVRKSGSGA